MKVWEIIGTEVKAGVDVESVEVADGVVIPAIALKANDRVLAVPVVGRSSGKRIAYARHEKGVIRPTRSNTNRGVIVVIRHIPGCILRACCVNFTPLYEPRYHEAKLDLVPPSVLIAGEGRALLSEVMFEHPGEGPVDVYTFWSPKSGENFWLHHKISETKVEIWRGSFLTALHPVPQRPITTTTGVVFATATSARRQEQEMRTEEMAREEPQQTDKQEDSLGKVTKILQWLVE